MNNVTSFNATQAAKGMQGTNRQRQASFNQVQAQPLQGAPQGMGPGLQQPQPAQGSSYTRGAGMMGTGPVPQQPGSPMQPSPIGPPPPQMTMAEMQDPANAAMAGYAFSATQDQAPSASTNPTPQSLVGARPAQTQQAVSQQPAGLGPQAGAQIQGRMADPRNIPQRY
jgi:hypothetical protein